MFRVNFAASVLFTAALVTNGAADAHPGHHHVSAASRTHHPFGHQLAGHQAHHGPASAHFAARQRHHSHVAMRHHSPRGAPFHHLALRRAGSRLRLAERNGGAPTSAGTRTGVQTGGASYYGSSHPTATGGSVGVATCAHRTLPFGTRVLVTNLANARAAVLTVNDRGPFVRGRIVDVSTAAAGILGMLHAGVAPVSVRVIGPG